MSRQLDDNSYSSANAIAVVGLNLALSYENAAVDRLEKRFSQSMVPEVKQKIIFCLTSGYDALRESFLQSINGCIFIG